ncbi:MAG: LysM peptidoglycan-binding domain-containing protein [Flavobacterium sp.]|nr:LysM peptidoglycan-binding domain-containing protein [Flavobacterium sp.]
MFSVINYLKYMKKIIFALAFLSFCFANAQTSNHLVLEKETLYGISKKYDISVDEIQNVNKDLLQEGLKVGQILLIPNKNAKEINYNNQNNNLVNKYVHFVQAKESLFSIARENNVSVQDLEQLNLEILKNGLQIGQKIIIPNKKKTLDGQARIINSETIFHIVLAKETKYSISKKYGITEEQLENQNPEIVNNLVEGNKLAININGIKSKTENDELMLALAQKQVAEEKIKAKNNELETAKDQLSVQKEMNQKVIKVNNLVVNLNDIDTKKGNSAEKLKLVLEANKNIQDILISKLDSLVITMNDDLSKLKSTEISDLENSKKLEKESYENISKTHDVLFQLKKDLSDNRKTYADLMNKVQRISLNEHQEYKKKLNENRKVKSNNPSVGSGLIDEIYKMQENQTKVDKRNKQLFNKLDSIEVQKKVELKRHINKATFYSSEARDYDDKMALVKLKRHQKQVLETRKNENFEKNVSTEDLKKALINNDANQDKSVNIKVLKNLKDVKNGFYLVVDILKDAEPRDKLVIKLMDSGNVYSSFFYDFNIFSYYVYTRYSEKLDLILYNYKVKEKAPNYEKALIVEIRNE